jgi:hypothetical protein
MSGRVRAESGERRVLRGGSWNNNGRNARSAQRNNNTPDKRNNNTGFRLARAQCDAGWRQTDQARIRSVAIVRSRRRKTIGPRYVGRQVDTRRRLAGGSSSWGATVNWIASGREDR